MIMNRWSARDDDRLVDLIYDAALDDALWPRVLEGVADRAGAQPANLLQINVVDGHGFGLSARTPDDTIATYFSQWARRNPLGLVDDAGDYRSGWTPRITFDRECLDRSLLERSEYWNEFLVPVGAHHMIVMRLALRGDNMTSIGLGRPNRGGPFEEDALASVRPFHRHLIRAERIWRVLGLRQAELDRFDTLLASSTQALFFVDDEHKVLRRTEPAEAIVQRGTALRLVAGRLRAVDGVADTELRRAFAVALAGGTPLPVTLTGRAFEETLSLSVARLGERALAGVTGARSLLVSIRPMAVPDENRTLRARYGLTAAETSLALALGKGGSLADIAAQRGVSVHTVRNQLSAVFDKTGCRRQQDLVRLLARRDN